MADAADLKSVVRKDVRVRLPPSAPQQNQRVTGSQRMNRELPGFASCVPMVCQKLMEGGYILEITSEKPTSLSNETGNSIRRKAQNVELFSIEELLVIDIVVQHFNVIVSQNSV
jgi:hypothetical protein